MVYLVIKLIFAFNLLCSLGPYVVFVSEFFEICNINLILFNPNLTFI